MPLEASPQTSTGLGPRPTAVQDRAVADLNMITTPTFPAG